MHECVHTANDEETKEEIETKKNSPSKRTYVHIIHLICSCLSFRNEQKKNIECVQAMCSRVKQNEETNGKTEYLKRCFIKSPPNSFADGNSNLHGYFSTLISILYRYNFAVIITHHIIVAVAM